MTSKNNDKLISGLTARKYLKCSKDMFEKLVKQGVIQAHRDEEMRWKVLKESVLNYVRQSQPITIHLVTNEDHYQEVIERICTAKTSIRIMTANFKRFNLKPPQKQGGNYKDGTPFIKYLMAKAVQGVYVQIICSRPSQNFMEEWQEYYKQMGRPGFFDYEFCERNHAKVIIIDDKLAYIGSANVTPAGLGQGTFSPGNFEAGILTSNPQIISSLKAHFAKIINEDYCSGCHRAEKCKR